MFSHNLAAYLRDEVAFSDPDSRLLVYRLIFMC